MSLHRHDPKVDLLATVALFGGCDRHELAVVARHADEAEVADGKILCRQGDPGQQFCVIMDGQATVSIDGTTIATLSRGEFFGEIALLDSGPCTATVTATGHLQLMVLTQKGFNAIVEAAPALKWKLLSVMGQRLRTADQALGHQHPRPEQEESLLGDRAAGTSAGTQTT
jgi:CRP/FNR family cyclic AMP-dependent transcriptional regulator